MYLNRKILAIFILLTVFAFPMAAFADDENDTGDDTTVVEPAFVSVTHITIAAQAGRTGQSLMLDYTIHPENATVQDVTWSLAGFNPSWVTLSGNVLSSTYEASIVVNARIEGGGAGRGDFNQSFTIHFSDSVITASLHGMGDFYSGVAVNAYVLFELNGGRFVDDIFPSDFFIMGLPQGLYTGEAYRVNETRVRLPIRGTPAGPWTGWSGWGPWGWGWSRELS